MGFLHCSDTRHFQWNYELLVLEWLLLLKEMAFHMALEMIIILELLYILKDKIKPV